jgi:O-antigen/teichoic acid export membrane protein
LFKASLIYFLIRGINGVLALGTIYILTRIMTAEQYGLYALGMASIGLLSSVSFQWITVAVSRFYAAHVDKPDVLLTEARLLFLRIAAVGLLVSAICAYWPPIPAVTPVLAWSVGIGAIAMGWHTLGIQVANASGQARRYGLLTVSRGALALLGAVAFVKVGMGGVGAVFGLSIACVVSALVFGFRSQTNDHRSNPQLRRQMITYGLPLTLTYLATMVLDVSDRFMIGWWLGPAAVAGYAAAYDLTQQTVGTALNVFFLASYPRITAAWEAGGAIEARLAMRPLARAMLICAPLVAGLFVGSANDISNIFFGASVRADAALVIPWVAIAIAIGCLKSYFLDISFQLAKVTHMQLRITVLMATLNVMLNLVLMPKYGVVGAAMSTAAAFAVGAVLSWWYGRCLGVYSENWREVISMMLTFLALVLAMKLMPSSENEGLPELFLRLLFGLTAFSASAFLTNLAGIRYDLTRKLQNAFNKEIK